MGEGVEDRARPKGRYVPLDVEIATKQTGEALKAKWGNDGLLVWILFIAACKSNGAEGTFRYTTEEAGWGKLGALATTFTLEEFFLFTGKQLRQTRKRKSGKVTYISCRNWGDWNSGYKTQAERERKQRQREGRAEVVKSPHSVVEASPRNPAKSDNGIPQTARRWPGTATESQFSRDSVGVSVHGLPANGEVPSGTLSHPNKKGTKDLKALRDRRREEPFQVPALREIR